MIQVLLTVYFVALAGSFAFAAYCFWRAWLLRPGRGRSAIQTGQTP